MTRRDLFRNRALLGLLARDVVSLTGSQMTWLALPWFVLTTTGSASRMAVVLAVESASAARRMSGAALSHREVRRQLRDRGTPGPAAS